MSNWVIIVAAGKAERFGGAIPKQYLQVCGRPLLSWTVSRFEACDAIDEICLVVAEEQLVQVEELVVNPFGFKKVSLVVAGGETRQQSVLNGLESLPEDTEMVAIHDGARPLTQPEDIARCLEAASESGAAIVAAQATDTVKRVEDGRIVTTLDRNRLWLAQTPQVFKYELILDAHRSSDSSDVTDDASLLEGSGIAVAVVAPNRPNFKVTTPDDLRIVATLLEQEI